MAVLGSEKGSYAVCSPEKGMCVVLKRPVMRFVVLRRGMSFALKRPVKQFIAVVMGCACF